MNKIISLSLITTAFLFSGCASMPALGNVKQYNRCSPIYETHVPGMVAQTEILMDALKENPSMADKVVPVSSTLGVIGQNAAEIGTGVAATVTAINGDVSVASVVGSAVMAGTKALMDARSEDKSQQRVSVCMPDDAEIAIFQNENAKLMFVKKSSADVVAAVNAYLASDKQNPPTFKELAPNSVVDKALEDTLKKIEGNK